MGFSSSLQVKTLMTNKSEQAFYMRINMSCEKWNDTPTSLRARLPTRRWSRGRTRSCGCWRTWSAVSRWGWSVTASTPSPSTRWCCRPRSIVNGDSDTRTINRWSCTITEKAPTRAFSWLKAPTTDFTFKTLLRHYVMQGCYSRIWVKKYKI